MKKLLFLIPIIICASCDLSEGKYGYLTVCEADDFHKEILKAYDRAVSITIVNQLIHSHFSNQQKKAELTLLTSKEVCKFVRGNTSIDKVKDRVHKLVTLLEKEEKPDKEKTRITEKLSIFSTDIRPKPKAYELINVMALLLKTAESCEEHINLTCAPYVKILQKAYSASAKKADEGSGSKALIRLNYFNLLEIEPHLHLDYYTNMRYLGLCRLSEYNSESKEILEEKIENKNIKVRILHSEPIQTWDCGEVRLSSIYIDGKSTENKNLYVKVITDILTVRDIEILKKLPVELKHEKTCKLTKGDTLYFEIVEQKRKSIR